MKKASNLTRLIYISTNIIPNKSFDQEIKNILEVARIYNKKNHITGALLFNSGHFAQVLEGSENIVEELFERIQADSRHSDCVVLCCKSTTTRSFDQWSMAYEGSYTIAQSQFGNLMQDNETTKGTISADDVFELLINHIKQATNGAAVI